MQTHPGSGGTSTMHQPRAVLVMVLALTAIAIAVPADRARAQAVPPPAVHTLTVTTSVLNPGAPPAADVVLTGTGAKCASACTFQLPTGARMVLTATAGASSAFRGWENAALCAEFPDVDATCTIAIGATDVTASAIFIHGKGLLSVNSTGDMTIRSDPPGIACGRALGTASQCAMAYPLGTRVRLAATPSAPGARIRKWSTWECAAGASVCDVTIDGTRAVTAFVLPFFVTLTKAAKDISSTIVYNPGGITCGPGCRTRRVKVLNSAHDVTVQVLPPLGQFSGWSAPCVVPAPPGVCSFYAYQDQTVIAAFGVPLFSTLSNEFKAIVVYRRGPGSVAVTIGGDRHYKCTKPRCSYALVPLGSNVVFKARPAAGKAFQRWDPGLCPGKKTCSVSAELIDAVQGVFK